MRLRWTIPAAEDLEAIKNYLEDHYPHFAELTVGDADLPRRTFYVVNCKEKL